MVWGALAAALPHLAERLSQPLAEEERGVPASPHEQEAPPALGLRIARVVQCARERARPAGGQAGGCARPLGMAAALRARRLVETRRGDECYCRVEGAGRVRGPGGHRAALGGRCGCGRLLKSLCVWKLAGRPGPLPLRRGAAAAGDGKIGLVAPALGAAALCLSAWRLVGWSRRLIPTPKVGLVFPALVFATAHCVCTPRRRLWRPRLGIAAGAGFLVGALLGQRPHWRSVRGGVVHAGGQEVWVQQRGYRVQASVD